MSKKICVFCSSSNSVSPSFFDTARQLGTQLARHDHQLIYGGTNMGLMGEVARSVHEEGGKVIGVVPRFIKERGITYDAADELLVTRDMRERKAEMERLADAFVALPGGFGTLEEVIEIVTLKQLGQHNKPIVFINHRRFYGHLEQFFEHIYTEQFAQSAFRKLYYMADTIQDLFTYLDHYRYEEVVSKWS